MRSGIKDPPPTEATSSTDHCQLEAGVLDSRLMRPTMLQHRQYAATRRTSVLLITLLLLMQSVLAYLVTPIAISSESPKGAVVLVLCTLEGARSIAVDLPDLLEDDPTSCPALELEHIASGITMGAPPPVLSRGPKIAIYRASEPGQAEQTSRFYAFITRAPPSLV